jgi:hypothetical protein
MRRSTIQGARLFLVKVMVGLCHDYRDPANLRKPPWLLLPTCIASQLMSPVSLGSSIRYQHPLI